LSAFQGHLYSESYREKIAQKEVFKTCEILGLDKSKLTGPRMLDSQGRVDHMEWRYESDNQRLIIGAWIHRDGHVEVYSGEM